MRKTSNNNMLIEEYKSEFSFDEKKTNLKVSFERISNVYRRMSLL